MMDEGTFCQPASLADTAKTPPVLPTPVVPATPPAPTRGTLPDTAAHDDGRAGSLPDTQAQIDQAMFDMQVLAGHTVADAAAVAQELIQGLGSEITQGTDQLGTWLHGIQQYLNDRLADARYGQYAAVTDYQTFVQAPVDVLNTLTAHGGNLQDLVGSLDLLTQLGIDVATKYTGMSPDQAKQLGAFKRDHFDPIVRGIGDVYNRLQGGFDIGTATLDFLRVLDDHLGDPKDFNKLQHRMLQAAQDLSDGLDNLSELLTLATEYLNAAQSAVLAACMLLHAAKQFIAQAQDILTHLPMLLASLVASLIPHGNLVFQVPRPVGTFLMAVDGMRGALAGLSDVGRCFQSLNEDDVTRAANDRSNNLRKQEMTADASSSAVQALLDKIALTLTQSLAGGLLKLLGLDADIAVPNPLDAVRFAWQIKTGLNDYKPPQPVILPEESALLSFIAGVGAIAGFIGGMIGSAFGHGTSEVSPESLYHDGVDPDGNPVAVTPHPGIGAKNIFQAVKEAFANARRTDVVASACQQSGLACQTLAGSQSEAAGREALDALCQAGAQLCATQNMALDAQLENLSPVAADHYACQGAAARDASATPPEQADLEAEFAKIVQAPPGAANSVAARMVDLLGLPVGTAAPPVDTLLTSLPVGALPPDYYDSAYVNTLVPVAGSYTLLPLLMLMSANSEYIQLQVLLNLVAELEAVRQDATQLEAHRSLLRKAVVQGVAADSPYVWLATGVDSLPTSETVLTALQHFLRHDRDTDIIPFANWLTAAGALDDAVPFVLDLTPAENDAAQASLAFRTRYGSAAAGIQSTLLTLRLRADEHGGALGYEYFVLAAILTLLGHIRDLLATPTSSPDEVTAVGAAALALADFVTHADFIRPMLAALAGEA